MADFKKGDMPYMVRRDTTGEMRVKQVEVVADTQNGVSMIATRIKEGNTSRVFYETLNDRRLFADRADAYKRAIELVEADLLEVFNRKEFLTKQRITLIKELGKV